MLARPNCHIRNCMYFVGVLQTDRTEITEVNFCKAFPEGIPPSIAYGNNLHTKPTKNQNNNIVFEKKE